MNRQEVTDSYRMFRRPTRLVRRWATISDHPRKRTLPLKNRSHDERARLHFRRWSTLLRMDQVRMGTSPYQLVTMGWSCRGPTRPAATNRRMGRPPIAVIDVEPIMFHLADHVSSRCRARSRAFGVSTGLCLGAASLTGPRVEGGLQ